MYSTSEQNQLDDPGALQDELEILLAPRSTRRMTTVEAINVIAQVLILMQRLYTDYQSAKILRQCMYTVSS